MIISAIAAVSKNNAIGVDNELPWHLPADLKFFKETTYGHHVIMGRKSFESIGKPLPGRTNIIVTTSEDFNHSGVVRKQSIPEAFAYVREAGRNEVFVLGGASVYEQTQNLWTHLYLTQVETVVEEATAFFPEVDFSQWNLQWQRKHPADERNEYDCTFQHYIRK